MVNGEASSPSIDLGGTVRAALPAATLARANALRPALGITRLANVTGLDHVGVPTWTAVRPLARSVSVSQGKGLTHELAQVSALMECIELHHAEHFVPRGHAATLQAAAHDARYAHPLLLPVRPDAQVDDRTDVEWVAGIDMATRDLRYVPRDLIELDSVTRRERPKIFLGSSNGLASGNTRDEAVLHALCEVIERDQQALWYLRRQLGLLDDERRLDEASIADPACRQLVDDIRKAGLSVVIWYATQDIGLPCFVCTIHDGDATTFYPQRAAGSGCHPCRRIALSRALTEALQSRLTHIAGARDDVYWSCYRERLDIDDGAGRDWACRANAIPATVQYGDVPEAGREATIGSLLRDAHEALAASGSENPIVVDLTREELAIPVVHVTVPGLEGHVTKPGYTPGPRARAIAARRR
jgi:ribosomal protein S12 methylthiotransferase accessory factor